MKRVLLPVLAAGLTTLAGTGHAADGTINFTGSVIGTTCNISINGTAAPAGATVTLAPATESDLDAPGKTAVPTPFDMMLTGCASTGKVSAYFESGPGVSGGLVVNTGTATNVSLMVYDNAVGAGNFIPLGAVDQDDTTRVNIVGGNATLKYGVKYIAIGGAATVGSVKGAVTYHILYE
ncbi:fimbrial protein [Variovorax sp. Sphag1AA]|uniref:fimbrial protein n=1 Tax=Variovorax sp. Sphag1AA TaxID=2587027 RepID=UPI00161F6E59|nr:fimbrial protein [Variovorax sp. Sphag1AA]MBB3175826.1 major type 1 subunit fimbrin (pilin) [Variovorax sp. Sphag1AA]